uniref:Proteasome subunit alpha type-2 n=1 Tax=Anas platyrhynchos platyrhynchos TaxID=8840 RepID=A0A493T1S8_ANAPP
MRFVGFLRLQRFTSMVRRFLGAAIHRMLPKRPSLPSPGPSTGSGRHAGPWTARAGPESQRSENHEGCEGSPRLSAPAMPLPPLPPTDHVPSHHLQPLPEHTQGRCPPSPPSSLGSPPQRLAALSDRTHLPTAHLPPRALPWHPHSPQCGAGATARSRRPQQRRSSPPSPSSGAAMLTQEPGGEDSRAAEPAGKASAESASRRNNGGGRDYKTQHALRPPARCCRTSTPGVPRGEAPPISAAAGGAGGRRALAQKRAGGRGAEGLAPRWRSAATASPSPPSAANGVVLATEKKQKSILYDERSVHKVEPITKHIGLVYSGMGPDYRVLVHRARKLAQQYYLVYHEPIPTAQLVQRIASVMQEYTQSGGVRPFGVSLLICGWNEGRPYLFQSDPSGAYFAWKATAMGKNYVNGKTFLEKRYNEDLELEDAIHTAILTLKESFEGQMTEDNIEVGICNEAGFRRLTPTEVKDYLAAIA